MAEVKKRRLLMAKAKKAPVAKAKRGRPIKINQDPVTGRFQKGNVANFRHGLRSKGGYSIVLGSTKNRPIRGAGAMKTRLLEFGRLLRERFGDRLTAGQEIQIISVISLLEKIWILDLFFRKFGPLSSKLTNESQSLVPQPALKVYVSLHNALRLGLNSLGVEPAEIDILTPYEILKREAQEVKH